MLNEHNRLLKRAIGMIDHEFYLFAGRQYGYFMFQTSNTDRMIYLNIEEPGLLFYIFLIFAIRLTMKYSSHLKKLIEKYTI